MIEGVQDGTRLIRVASCATKESSRHDRAVSFRGCLRVIQGVIGGLLRLPFRGLLPKAQF